MAATSSNAVIFEPRQHPLPTVVSLRSPIACAVIGVKTVRCVRVDHDLRRFVQRLQRGSHSFNLCKRNSLVGAAVHAEYRHVDARHKIEWILASALGLWKSQRTIPCHARLEPRIVRGV